MTITSISFFIFVLAGLIVYYCCPKKFRWLVLLALSLAFYGIICFKYFPFIIFTSASTWAGAIWLNNVSVKRKNELKAHKADWSKEEKSKFKSVTTKKKRWILVLILVLNFGILGFLKYFNFFAGWISSVLGFTFTELSLVLPLGISFYTFQVMGYIIDIYWDKVQPEKNYAKFLLFASFFPQIIQGPISLYDELAGQLYEGHNLQYENIKYGFQLILWGLFKKMVIADRLVTVINNVLPAKNGLSNAYSLFALLVYAAQIYADFSGGIDIAIGVGQMFGIKMPINFKRPYFSKSISDFWRRWHVSLGKWMRTYLFYPIAVSKAFLSLSNFISELRRDKNKEYNEYSLWGGISFAEHMGKVIPGCIATLITFFVVGMWHGANWKYAGYGLWNGLVILIAMILEPVFKWLLRKLKINVDSTGWRVWQIIRTFIVVLGAYIFDIADSFGDAISMLGKCLNPLGGPTTHLGEAFSLGIEVKDWIVASAGLVIILLVSIYQERTKKSIRESLATQTLWLQWALTLGCLICILLFGVYGPGVSAGEFVYMQF